MSNEQIGDTSTNTSPPLQQAVVSNFQISKLVDILSLLWWISACNMSPSSSCKSSRQPLQKMWFHCNPNALYYAIRHLQSVCTHNNQHSKPSSRKTRQEKEKPSSRTKKTEKNKKLPSSLAAFFRVKSSSTSLSSSSMLFFSLYSPQSSVLSLHYHETRKSPFRELFTSKNNDEFVIFVMSGKAIRRKKKQKR